MLALLFFFVATELSVNKDLYIERMATVDLQTATYKSDQRAPKARALKGTALVGSGGSGRSW